jgi:two-component system cell cycle response regulator
MMTDSDTQVGSCDGSKQWKLLLAEDEPVQRKLFHLMLIEQGYEVETVATGDEALERVLGGGFPILLTDWDMPGLDGADLCRRIREAKLKDHVYILMITSHSSASDMVLAITAGANDYIRKPPDKAELFARLKSACELVGVQRELRATVHQLRAANAEIARMSRVDLQLGCYNRHYLNEQLPREVANARRYDKSLALVMVDFDNFKEVNDAHGHLVADEVLKGLVERVLMSLRQSSDWIARFGGDEFAIVLPETNLQGARSVAEKLCTNCAATPFNTSVGPVNVTVSLGVASLRVSTPADDLSLSDITTDGNDLLARADSALYRSKTTGRNRVSVSEETVPGIG